MAGRIRTIKPEWLEDEKLSMASVECRLLSVALLLLADDHGRGRAHPAYLASSVYPADEHGSATARRALSELVRVGYVRTYVVRGQTYYEVVNWKKHQRVDKPGAPRIPAFEEADPPGNVGESPVANRSREIPERVANNSGAVRDNLATDLRSPISITDPDEDPDPPEPEPPSRPKTEPSPESSSSREPSPVVGQSTGGIQPGTGGIQPGAGAYSTEVDPKGRLNGLDLQTATDEQLCVIALRRVHMLRSDEVTLLREARLLAVHAATKSLGKREICEHVAEAVNKLARKLPEAAHEGKPFKPSAVYAFVARVAKRLFDEEREAG